MKWSERFKERVDENLSIVNLLKVLLMALIVFLFVQTEKVWAGIFLTIMNIIKPFLIGFIIAYLLYPVVKYLEVKGIKKKIVIPILFVLLLVFIVALIFAITPMLVDRGNQLINSLLSSMNYVLSLAETAIEDTPSNWILALVDQFQLLLRDTGKWIPSISSKVPVILSALLSFTTVAIFTIIISIYFLFDYKKVTSFVDTLMEGVHPDIPKIFHEIDYQIGTYVRSLLLLMAIKFLEYSLLYIVVGHNEWLIIAILMSLGLIVPYFGATFANTIGLLSALTLPLPSILILVVGIIILSTVDAYIIAPLIYMKGNRIPPLWTLFSVFACGSLFGPIGVMLAVPIYMICRVVFNFYYHKRRVAL